MFRAMSRDENIYKDPEIFNPDRFVDPSVPALPAFGWGRRYVTRGIQVISVLFIPNDLLLLASVQEFTLQKPRCSLQLLLSSPHLLFQERKIQKGRR
jgi:hypothetical protein